MSIGTRLRGLLDGGAQAFGVVADRVATAFAGDPVLRRQVAFSIALIGLSAKMAKADGVVTRDEVDAFRGVVILPAGEEQNAVRLFNLAKRDVAGFESYAARIAGIYDGDRPALEDVIDGLFAIARADGAVHNAEMAYLARVAEIFGIDDDGFERIAARHVVGREGDPYLILGIEPATDFAGLRRHYRRLVVENHPDRLIARGLPREAIAIATDRLAVINRAWERIERERA